jgi:hypothetical protein
MATRKCDRFVEANWGSSTGVDRSDYTGEVAEVAMLASSIMASWQSD